MRIKIRKWAVEWAVYERRESHRGSSEQLVATASDWSNAFRLAEDALYLNLWHELRGRML